MSTLEKPRKNFWRRWHLNCVLKNGDTSYSGEERIMGEGVTAAFWGKKGTKSVFVLKNVIRTLNAMLRSLCFILTRMGSHWIILSRAVTGFYSSYIILEAEGRRDWRVYYLTITLLNELIPTVRRGKGLTHLPNVTSLFSGE